MEESRKGERRRDEVWLNVKTGCKRREKKEKGREKEREREMIMKKYIS